MFTLQTLTAAVLYLLEAIKRFSADTKFYQASTSEMFGKIMEPIQNEHFILAHLMVSQNFIANDIELS